MTVPTQPEVLAYLREHGPSTVSEVSVAFGVEESDDPRKLRHLVLTQLIRLQRHGLVLSLREPAGKGKIYSVVPEAEGG
jgi:hypothetical protein